jgi:signal transduction histidine kinase
MTIVMGGLRSLCYELIEQHNGRIWFESKEGQGTTFFVALPRTCGVTGFESNS